MGEHVSERISNKVFVRNLPFTFTNDDLESCFSEIGPLKKSFVVKDKGSDKCKGYGYVTFSLREDAENAVKSVQKCEGRKLEITYANKKNKQKQAKQKPQDEDQDGSSDDDVKPTPQPVTTPTTKYTKKKGEKVYLVELQDLPNNTTIEDIRKISHGIDYIDSLHYPVQDGNKTKAVIKILDDVNNAVQIFKKRKIKGKNVKVCLQSAVSEVSSKLSRLIIRNLSFNCDEETLKNEFSKFGEVTESRIPIKENGRKMGFGFVRFLSVQMASAALKAMNAQPILGRPVAVDWALAKDRYLQAKDEVKGESDNGQKLPETVEKQTDDSSDSDNGEKDADEDDDASEEEGEDSEDAVSVDAISEDEDDDVDMSGGSSDEDSEVEPSDDDDEDSMEGDSDDDEDDDDSDSDEEDRKDTRPQKPRKESHDVEEGKTVFIRNLSYDSFEDDVIECLEEFGDVEYCKVVLDKETEHSKGMAFVKFSDKDSADQCMAKANDNTSKGGITLDSRRLNVSLAISREKAMEINTDKKSKNEKIDKKNLHLVREGMVRAGTKEAQGLTKLDLAKRDKILAAKRAKLKNPNVFVSSTRLCIHNIPKAVDDKELKKIFLNAVADKSAKIKECRIMRDLKAVNTKGIARSRGYAFIEFATHEQALKALKSTNNNPELFGDTKRLIVEFSLENKAALLAKQKRLERNQTKSESMQNKPERQDWKKGRLEKKQKIAENVLSSVKPTATDKEKQKGPKGLPSHWGPKVRHVPRGPAKSAAKPKGKVSRNELKRKLPENEKPDKPEKKQTKKRIRREITDDFDNLVNKYKDKFTGNSKKFSAKSSKWFE